MSSSQHTLSEYITNQPPEIVHTIFQYLSPSDLCKSALTHKYWNAIAKQIIWKTIRLDIVPSSRRKLTAMHILGKHASAGTNLVYTVDLELDFRILHRDMESTEIPGILEQANQNYQLLRDKLIKWISIKRLKNLKIYFPELRQPYKTLHAPAWSEWSSQITEILTDVPVFITKLVEVCGVLNVHLHYISGGLGCQVTPEYLPMLPHVSKFNYLVNSVEIQISPEIIESSILGPTSNLKHLILRYNIWKNPKESRHSSGRTMHLGIWSDLRKCPLETLTLIEINVVWPLLLPTTITKLSIDNSRSVTWALKVAFFQLPNLLDFSLEDPQCRPPIIALENQFHRAPIVCTRLQSLRLKNSNFEHEFLGRIASECRQLSSIIIKNPTIEKSRFIEHFVLDRFDQLPLSIQENYPIRYDTSGFEDNDYWQTFMRGFPEDIVHVVYGEDKVCDCDTLGSWYKKQVQRDCYCDINYGWELRRCGKDVRNAYPKLVVVHRDGSERALIRMITIPRDKVFSKIDVMIYDEDAKFEDLVKIKEWGESEENAIMYWRFHRRYLDLDG